MKSICFILLLLPALAVAQNCQNGVLYLKDDKSFDCNAPSAIKSVSIPNAKSQRNVDAPPNNAAQISEFFVTGVSGKYKNGLNSVSYLLLDANTYGIGVQARISYDFEGDGNWDRHEVLPIFSTDAVTGQFEKYQANGVSSSPFRDLQNGIVRIQVWSAFARDGVASVRVGGNDASRISIPFDSVSIGGGQASTSQRPPTPSSEAVKTSAEPIKTSEAERLAVTPPQSAPSGPALCGNGVCGARQACCGVQCFDPTAYSCPTDSNTGESFLCPFSFAACSRQCYNPSIYHCTPGGLRQGASPSSAQTPAPSVVVPPVPVPQTSNQSPKTSTSELPRTSTSAQTPAPSSAQTPAPSVVVPPVPVPNPPPSNAGLPDTNARWSEQYGANAGEVVIPSGRSVLFDLPRVTVKSIRISEGANLVFDHRSQSQVSLTTEGIFVNGGFWIGSQALPFEGTLTITLTGATTAVVDGYSMGTKAILVGNKGIFEVHGAKGLGNSWVQLAQTATQGSARISLSESIDGGSNARGWKVGDQIVIAGTDYAPDQSERVTITRIIDSKNVEFTPALRFYHHGTITKGVDERAEVGLLTRNVRIIGTNDNKKGGQIAFLKGTVRVRMEGIETLNLGQDQIARYPIHFHLTGRQYDSWIKDVSIHDSNFRCITIHGAQGVSVSDSVMFNNPGHCIYLEDGVEYDNSFTRVLVTNVLEKRNGERMGSDIGTAVSGFWITHPGNTFVKNVVVGSTGAGYWIHVRNSARGLSKNDPQYSRTYPNMVPLKEFRDNKGVGCDHGFQIEATHFDGANVPLNAQFETPMAAYTPKINGKDAPIYLDGFVAHHNRFRGLWARANVVYVRRGAFSNNMEAIQLATSGDHPVPGSIGYIEDTKVIGWTDNIGNNIFNNYQMWNDVRKRSWPRNGIPMVGIAYYDGPQVIRRCTFDGWKVNANETPHSAIGTRFHGEFQVASTNALEDSYFNDVTHKVYVSDRNGDGGKSFNFRAADNSMGTPQGTILPNWGFYKADGCVEDAGVGLLCPQRYAQIWVIDTRNKGGNAMTITRNEHPGNNHDQYALTYNGFHSAGIWRYQPLVSIGATYLVSFRNNPSDSLVFQLNNAEAGDTVGIAVCYPRGSTIRRVQRGYSNKLGGGLLPPIQDGGNNNIPAAGSQQQASNGDSYYYDQSRGLLMVYIKQRRAREDYANFCPNNGCDFVHIEANVAGGSTGDCYNSAYNNGQSIQVTNSPWLSSRL